MKALFSGKRRLAARLRQEEIESGKLSGDIIGNETHFLPTFWERLKILFGAGVLVELAIQCEVAPGKMKTTHEVHIVWPQKSELREIDKSQVRRCVGDVVAQVSGNEEEFLL